MEKLNAIIVRKTQFHRKMYEILSQIIFKAPICAKTMLIKHIFIFNIYYRIYFIYYQNILDYYRIKTLYTLKLKSILTAYKCVTQCNKHVKFVEFNKLQNITKKKKTILRIKYLKIKKKKKKTKVP